MKKVILTLIVVCLLSAGPRMAAQSDLRFAQITDPHLFDAGYSCYGTDVVEEQKQNKQAIDWAVQKVNEVHSKTALDFLVITGDFGLVNTSIAGKYQPTPERPTRNACGSKQPQGAEFGPVPAITVETAAARMAAILGQVKINSIYLVPGNNDVPYNADLGLEDPADRELYKAFVQALAQRLPGRIRDLTQEAPSAWNSPPLLVRGYTLAGLDTASFKPSELESKAAKPPQLSASSNVADWPQCPAAYPHGPAADKRQAELERVAKLTGSTAHPFLLFTHVPDVQDPFKGRQSSVPNRCRFPSSWFLDPLAMGEWTDIAANPNMVGLFAGHFHDSDSSHYGRLLPSASVPNGAQVMIAPPLAIKNQWSGAPSRGLLIVSVKDRSVTAKTYWLPLLAESKPSAGTHPLCYLAAHWLMMTLYLLAAIIVLVTDLQARKARRALDLKP